MLIFLAPAAAPQNADGSARSASSIMFQWQVRNLFYQETTLKRHVSKKNFFVAASKRSMER